MSLNVIERIDLDGLNRRLIAIGMSVSIMSLFRKVPKFSDARKLCCYLPKIQTESPNLRVFCQKRCKWNSKQWRPRSDCSSRSSLIWVCTVCPDLSVRKLWINTVNCESFNIIHARWTTNYYVKIGYFPLWTFGISLWEINMSLLEPFEYLQYHWLQVFLFSSKGLIYLP